MTDKRQSRKKQTSEFFTPKEIIDVMLSKLNQDCWSQDKTFIDNSCGIGNFLIEVLERKLKLGHDPTRALSTVYGVDLMPDNVGECRVRLLNVLKEYIKPTQEHVDILKRNIVCHDALTYDYSFDD